jgi:Family of unknown function (DUF6489)
MKVTVEVDRTPEEARRFLGLPDVVPTQQAVMEKLQQRLISAVDATTPEGLLKAWMPMAPDQMQQAFAKLFDAFWGIEAGRKELKPPRAKPLWAWPSMSAGRMVLP